VTASNPYPLDLLQRDLVARAVIELRRTRAFVRCHRLRVFERAAVRSGRSMDRPGLAALLDYARTGDTLAVVRLDRLGRSLAELLATVAMLKERGITLLSLEERIDTGSAAGVLVFYVFGAIAHFVPEITARFCRGHDELRNLLHPRSRRNQHVPAARCRLLFLRRTVTVLAILEAA